MNPLIDTHKLQAAIEVIAKSSHASPEDATAEMIVITTLHLAKRVTQELVALQDRIEALEALAALR